MELRKGWLARQCKRVEEDFKTWPVWMQRAAKTGERTMTDNTPIHGNQEVEVIRVLKYRGQRAWIEQTLENSFIGQEQPYVVSSFGTIHEASREMKIVEG